MITRPHRFHGRGSLRAVYQRGQAVRAGQLTLRFLLNQRRRNYRAAVVVSRKVHKSAVVRNRIRRRVYEIVRTHEAALSGPFDLVFVIYDEQLATMPGAELRLLVVDMLRRAGAITKDR